MTTSWDLGDDEPAMPQRKRPARPRKPRAAATPEQPAENTPARRRRLLPWTIAVAGVLLIGAGGAWWLATRDGGATATAEAYLEALASGDGAALSDLVTDPVPEETVAAFSEATDHLTEPALEDVTTDGDRAVVTATAALVDDLVDLRFEMTRGESGWSVDGTSQLTALAEPAGTLAIGAVKIPSDEPVALFPARYEVTATPAEIVTGSESVRILPGAEPQSIAIATTVADGAERVAQGFLDAYAEGCTEPTSEVPAACGVTVPWAADLVELERVFFRVERTPQIELDLVAGRFAATGGIVEATAHGITHEGVTASFDYRAEDWALRGSIRFEDGQLRLSVF